MSQSCPDLQSTSYRDTYLPGESRLQDPDARVRKVQREEGPKESLGRRGSNSHHSFLPVRPPAGGVMGPSSAILNDLELRKEFVTS